MIIDTVWSEGAVEDWDDVNINGLYLVDISHLFGELRTLREKKGVYAANLGRIRRRVGCTCISSLDRPSF